MMSQKDMNFINNAEWNIKNYNLQLLARTENILNALRDKNIPAILLKGAALLCETYQDPSERIMGDVDILVKKKDFEKAEKILTENGLSFVGGNLSNAAVYGSSDYYVDLHRSLFNPKSPAQTYVYSPDNNAVFDRSVPLKINSSQTLRLGNEDRIVYLCFHIQKERFSNEKWFRDISLVLKKQEALDINKLIQIAKKCGTYKLCAMTIEYMFLRKKIDKNIFSDVQPRKEFFLYGFDFFIFRSILDIKIKKLYFLRGILWFIVMDSAVKKVKFLCKLITYVPAKIFRKK